jgi:hypothetical protein
VGREFIFRVTSVKHNFSAPDVDDRWFRYVSVELPNQQPPIYPNGDKVAVVEVFKPGLSASAYPTAMIRDALKAIDGASPPLSPSKQAKGRYAVDAIAHAIAHHRGGKVSDVEAEGVLGHIRHSGLAVVKSVKMPRAGGRADDRNGLVVTPEGKAAMQQPDPAGVATTKPPQSPQSSRGNGAGQADSGSPKGPRNVPGGCGGNAGAKIAGQSADPNSIKTAPQALGAEFGVALPPTPTNSLDSPADSQTATRAGLHAGQSEPHPEGSITGAATPAAGQHGVDLGVQATLVPEPDEPPTPATVQPGEPVDDLDIPAFLRRPLPGRASADTAPGPDTSTGLTSKQS